MTVLGFEIFSSGFIASVLFAIQVICWVTTIPRILYIKTDARLATAWILCVLLLPFIGTIVFYTFADPAIHRPLRKIMQGDLIFTPSEKRVQAFNQSGPDRRLDSLLDQEKESPPTIGNRVKFFHHGKKLFRELTEDLLKAQHEICFQYFIVEDDDTGDHFVKLLAYKARQGISVYFIYDSLGSKRLQKSKVVYLRENGVKVHSFLPVRIFRQRFQINYRNHRKLVVVDRKIAYTGGFNIGDSYAERGKKPRRWFDAHTRMTGPAVFHLVDEFSADWEFADYDEEKHTIPEHPAWLELPEHVDIPNPEESGWVQTISSGPDQQLNRMSLLFFHMATRAQKRLWILTPYFVPDEPLLRALLTASLSGVDVRIISQSAKPDLWVAYFAANYFAEPLVKRGVKFMKYQPGMMHAKIAIMDDQIATLGSANLDERSLNLNFELNLIFFSKYEREECERIFKIAESKSEPLGEKFFNRGIPRRVLENLCRLLGPIL